jgi:hypothetical protein
LKTLPCRFTIGAVSKWVQKFQRDPDTEAPAGGVSSSVNDLAKWIRLELANGKFEGKTIVDEKALIEARRPHMLTGYNPFTGVPTFYGLGWNVGYDDHGRLHLNHSGAFDLGAATYVHLLPGEQLGIVVLTNAYPIRFAEGLGTTFVDLALYGRSTHDWFALFKKVFSNPAVLGLSPGFRLHESAGVARGGIETGSLHRHLPERFLWPVSVSEQRGALAMIIGPRNKSFPLQHYDRDTFTYQTEGENAAGLSGVTFTIGADGKAREMTVENLNIHGEGYFKRLPR